MTGALRLPKGNVGFSKLAAIGDSTRCGLLGNHTHHSRASWALGLRRMNDWDCRASMLRPGEQSLTLLKFFQGVQQSRGRAHGVRSR